MAVLKAKVDHKRTAKAFNPKDFASVEENMEAPFLTKLLAQEAEVSGLRKQVVQAKMSFYHELLTHYYKAARHNKPISPEVLNLTGRFLQGD